MTFLAVTSGKDIEVDEFSGIVGLSPSETPLLGHPYLDEFANKLQKIVGKKVKPIFSFYLSNVDG